MRRLAVYGERDLGRHTLYLEGEEWRVQREEVVVVELNRLLFACRCIVNK